MTNEQIILTNRVFLMEEGVIGATDERFVFEDEKGRREIQMPEEIHTFKEWKKRGFMVKKGEHSIARFPIWKKSNGKGKFENPHGDDDDEEATGGGDRHGKGGRYYMQVAFFFTKDQVEPIKPPAS